MTLNNIWEGEFQRIIAESTQNLHKLCEMYLSDFSGIFLALASTTAISVIPNLLLYLIPVSFLSQSTFNGLNVRKTMLSFACGGLLGDVFFHTLPHLVGLHHHNDNYHHEQNDHHHHDHHHDHGGGVLDRFLGQLLKDEEKRALLVASNILAGFLFFFTLQRVMSSHGFGAHANDLRRGDKKGASPRGRGPRSRTRSSSSTPSLKISTRGSSGGSGWLRDAREAVTRLKGRLRAQGWLNLAADSLHNFTDGLAVGASFSSYDKCSGQGSNFVGLTTVLSVLLHEIPHEVGDFTVLVSQGLTKTEAIQAQFFTAGAAFLGTFCGLWGASGDRAAETLLLAWTAGGFLYIATVGMVPTVLEVDSSESKLHVLYDVVALISGCALMLAVALLE